VAASESMSFLRVEFDRVRGGVEVSADTVDPPRKNRNPLN